MASFVVKVAVNGQKKVVVGKDFEELLKNAREKFCMTHAKLFFSDGTELDEDGTLLLQRGEQLSLRNEDTEYVDFSGLSINSTTSSIDNGDTSEESHTSQGAGAKTGLSDSTPTKNTTSSIGSGDISEESHTSQGARAKTGPSDSTPTRENMRSKAIAKTTTTVPIEGNTTLDRLKKRRCDGCDDFYQVKVYISKVIKKKQTTELLIKSRKSAKTEYALSLRNQPGNSEVDYSAGTLWQMELIWNHDIEEFEPSNTFKPIKIKQRNVPE